LQDEDGPRKYRKSGMELRGVPSEERGRKEGNTLVYEIPNCRIQVEIAKGLYM